MIEPTREPFVTSSGRLPRALQDYAVALDQTSIVAITDRHGIITYVNEKFCEISQFSREELIGRTHRVVNSDTHPKTFFEALWKTIASGKIWRGEICNRAKGGRLYWVDTTIVPFLDDRGVPYQYVAIRTDITERKRLEAEVIRQDRLASIGFLASGLAHEIGNPLGVIRGRAELLKMELDGKESDSIGVMIDQIDRISRFIRSLLRFSRSKGDVLPEPVRLLEVVHESVVLVEEKLRKNRVELNINVASSHWVMGDFDRIQQMIVNFLINAVQAILEAVKTHPEAEREIRVDSALEGKRVVLRIADTGCGMEPEAQALIFKPFFTTKDVGEGTGLGLAVVEKIADELGATLEVTSRKGHGSTFSVSFLGRRS